MVSNAKIKPKKECGDCHPGRNVTRKNEKEQAKTPSKDAVASFLLAALTRLTVGSSTSMIAKKENERN